MIVYCEGRPPDATHERFVVAHYQQHLAGNTLVWLPQPRFEDRGRRGHTHAVQQFIGPDGRPQANQDTPIDGGRIKIRLHCDDCGYDWNRRTDTGPDVLAAMFAVFDRLAAAGYDEISVLALISRI